VNLRIKKIPDLENAQRERAEAMEEFAAERLREAADESIESVKNEMSARVPQVHHRSPSVRPRRIAVAEEEKRCIHLFREAVKKRFPFGFDCQPVVTQTQISRYRAKLVKITIEYFLRNGVPVRHEEIRDRMRDEA
jgi:hypothetical protein